MIVNVNDFTTFLHRCASEHPGNIQDVFIPVRQNDSENGCSVFKRLTGTPPVVMEGYRTIDPVKVLFYLFREHMINRSYENRLRIIAGVRACDLRGMQILDRALINDDFYDPSYKHWREHSYIISSDCTDLAASCHCSLVDGKPYAEAGFDLNLSRIDDDYVLTVGSPKGEKLIALLEEIGIPVQDTPEMYQSRVDDHRSLLLDRLKKQNQQFSGNGDYAGLKNGPMKFWHSASENCVGCGACTNICSTCYCLILNDESKKDTFLKVRSYDSCQIHGYARVAGGASPRPLMDQRFRNRYLCKFLYMDSNFDSIGCSGCGRCVDACPAGIDLRNVITSSIYTTETNQSVQQTKTGEV